ncbi:MAG TPA: ABC transporter transmembrane domain-containing protein, partial [Gaiellaceae bacterium]|nr:ABC transporter transmembrane domain-containing protein [Gaiellaceae bacterium]
MKVWQFSSHLTDERGAKVDDWSWRRTRRRLRTLARLARPYRGRALMAVVTLVAFTGVALLPPLFAKVVIDDGIGAGDTRTIALAVVAFLVTAFAVFAFSGAQTYYTGWVGERGLADLRIDLFRHLQRLSLGYYERNRTGAIVSRITNDV